MTNFKEGDKVEFDHVGSRRHGVVVEVLENKIRIKDSEDYMYRYSPENVWIAGTRQEPDINNGTVSGQPVEFDDEESVQQTNINQQVPQGQEPMAKSQQKKVVAKKEKPAAQSTKTQPENSNVDAGQKAKIAALACKKHQRIYLLHSIGVDKKEIMELAGANAGEIYNAIKAYAGSPEKVEVAKALLG